ncbi:cupin domain-containing protein [Arhodomonas sp. SL1]|uniref:cupin domain-containing protein n=1 Tax=Arhodomonas sp. SL1 TaxID=3425691 RepID=UPI003F881698
MPENRPQAHADLQCDDDRVRITRWTFPPGGETGWHRHEYDYIVVPGTDGLLQIVDASGENRATLSAGVSYQRRAGTEHNVINAGDRELWFVEVELKDN